MKEKGKEDVSKNGSGSAATVVKKSSWQWFGSLEWLKDHIKPKDTFSNLSTSAESSGQSSEETPLKSPPEKKVKFEDKLLATADNLIKQIQTPSTTNMTKEKTEDELFGELVTKKLSKISDGEVKEDLKLEILSKINKTTFYRPIGTGNN